MASTNTATAKTHVSLRLPTYLLESIDAHAERESISRTEAFVFYLQTGLDIADTKAEEPSKDESMLQSIQEELAEIKAMLQAQGISASQADIAVPTSSDPEPVMSEEAAAESEAYAEELFTGSDAVSEGTPTETQDEQDLAASTSVESIAAAEQTAEEEFSGSDAVVEESFTTEDDDEDDEDEFTTSDAVAEELSYAADDEETYTAIKPVDDMSEFTTSDETYEADEPEEEEDAQDEDEADATPSYFSSFYATSSSDDADEAEVEEDDEEVAPEEEFSYSDAAVEDNDDELEADEESELPAFDEDDLEDEDDDEEIANEFIGGSFMTSDEDEEPMEEEEDDSFVDPCDEALSFKKLEKAVTKASKQIDIIEKVWLFGAAADEEEIVSPVIDLCVKTDDDKKLKSKHLDPFVAAIEEKTGKIVNVVLRHEVEDKSELQNRVELYKN